MIGAISNTDQFGFDWHRQQHYVGPSLSYSVSKHWTVSVEPAFGLSDVSEPFVLRVGFGIQSTIFYIGDRPHRERRWHGGVEAGHRCYQQLSQVFKGDEEMKLTRMLFVSILGLLLMAPLQAQTPTQSSAMDPASMKSQMEKMKAQSEQMRTQMEEIQALTKDNMAKVAAADAAMKSHMETEQATMKSQMELQQAMISQLQTMTDHVQAMTDHMTMLGEAMDMHKKDKKK